jgi:hypothetical protein
MNSNRPQTPVERLENLLEQQDDEEIVEIDSSGRIYRSGEGPREATGRKPTVLRDPMGEYGFGLATIGVIASCRRFQ